VTAPFLLWQTRLFILPSVRADAAISRLETDFVVIDTDGLGLAMDQVRNDPMLRNRPLRFSSRHLNLAQIDLLCTRGSVTFVSREDLAAFGIVPDDASVARRFPALRDHGREFCRAAVADVPDRAARA
jgi:hypothetical protein